MAVQNGIIETASGDLLRSSFGAVTAGAGETERNDVPHPSKVRGDSEEANMHRWNGSAWVEVAQPATIIRPQRIPVLTTTQRDALTGVAGFTICNSTTGMIEFYDGLSWLVVGPSDAHGFIDQGLVKFVKYSMNDFVSGSSGGTGSMGTTARKLDLLTGTTASSYQTAEPDGGSAESFGNDRDVLNWDKGLTLATALTPLNITANGRLWLGMGDQAGVILGNDPTSKWAGFRIDGAAIKGYLFKTVSPTVIDLSSIISTVTTPQLTMKLDGLGNAEWLVNGVSKGTSDGAPVGTVNSAHSIAAIANKADAAQHRVYIHNFDWAVTV